MDHDTFIGKVQSGAAFESRGEADSATRAVLTTLGERITEDEAEDLAAQLPMEIGRYLTENDHAQQFDADEFVDRVAERATAADVEDDPLEASQVVLSVVTSATADGEIGNLVSQLPKNEGYGALLGEADAVSG